MADKNAEHDEFIAVYKEVSAFLVSDAKSIVGDIAERLQRLFDYTCLGGKLTRGKTVARLVKAKGKGESASKKQKLEKYDDPDFIAQVVGWGIEWMQAFFLVEDDIMDQSTTRRGHPCWYKKTGTAMAINDGCILNTAIFRLLKQYTGNKTYYAKLVELFNEVCYYTELGQMLDVLSVTDESGADTNDFSRFTPEHYANIVKHKTCYYTFYLPLALGLAITGDLDETVTRDEVRDLSVLIGTYFQAKDDMLDVYGTPEQIGKVGTDIQDKKCSWLACEYYKTASEEERAVFRDSYGVHDDAKIAKIRQIFTDAKLKERFEEYEENVNQQVLAKLKELKLDFLRETLDGLWAVTYKRDY